MSFSLFYNKIIDNKLFICYNYIIKSKEREENKMSLKKAIKYGKEYRQPYRGNKIFDKACRNHGGCPICEGNRKYKYLKTEQKMLDRLKEF